jgi:tetratricopeptide (TPR) repeat protein
MVPTTPPAVVVTIANMIIKSYNRLEQFDVALADGAVLLERFATLDTEAQYWLLIGDAHRGKGDDADTEAAYQRAFDLIGENRVLQSYWNELVPANAAMGLAAMMVRRGAQDEARDVLERATRLGRLSQKASAKLKGALASTYAGTGMVAEAWDTAQTALETLPELRTNLANSFIDHNEPLLAMRIMAPAMDPLILRDRVMTMAASLLGDRRAIDLLEWLLAEYGEDGPTRVNMGLHWLSLNEPDLAREAIAAGLGESPSAGVVEIRMAFFEQVLGRPEAAEARLAATVQAAAEAGAEGWLAEALVQWGNLAFQMSQWDKAADLLTEALARRPQDPYVHYALASSRYGQGDLIAAREGYERALLIDPTFAPAHQGLDALNRLAGTSSIS